MKQYVANAAINASKNALAASYKRRANLKKMRTRYKMKKLKAISNVNQQTLKTSKKNYKMICNNKT